MSLPSEVRKKVKLLEVGTRKLVNSLFLGQYRSAFRGQGMTFAEFREYVPGDDVRAIAWPLTARTGKTFIKKFDEERELTLMLLVDVSGSVDFGSQEYLKGEAMLHMAALLGFAAAKNNDHVGLLLASDRVEHFVPPKKGRGHVQRILRDLYMQRPISKKTKLSVSLDFLQGILKKRAVVFIFSDFLDRNYAEPMRRLARKHELIAVCVRDPLESLLPELGLLDIEDPESGEVITIDSSSARFRQLFKEQVAFADRLRKTEMQKAGVTCIDVSTGPDFLDPLIQYFRARGSGRSSRRA